MESNKHTGKAKLSIDQVILCLTELKGVSARELSRRWGVSHATVNNVRQGKSWREKLFLLGIASKTQRSTPVKENASLQPAQETLNNI
jgi:lambda repressor-like predicted transcriptional regulator